MQAVSSSYQLDDAKVAISGNLKSQAALNSGVDFSKILKDCASVQKKASQRASSEVPSRQFVAREIRREKSVPEQKGRNDGISLNKNCSDNSPKREVEADSLNTRNQLNQVSDEVSDKDLGKVSDKRYDTDESMDAKAVISEADSEDSADITSKREFIRETNGEKQIDVSEPLQLQDELIRVDTAEVSEAAVNTVSSAESAVDTTVKSSVLTDLAAKNDTFSDSGTQLDNVIISDDVHSLFSKISEIAAENGIDLTTVDPKVLNDLVYKMSSSPLTEFDTREFEKAAALFLKGDLKSFDSLQSTESAPQVKPFAALDDVMSMLKDLDGTVKINNEKPLFSVTEDFGARDFEVIEDSIKASLSMDEILAKEDVKTKINSIIDSKKDSIQSSLEKSVALLQKVVSAASLESEVKSEIPSSRVDAFAINPRSLTESSINLNPDGFMSGSFSEQGKSSMFSQSNPNGYGSLASAMKTGGDLGMTAFEGSKLDLLNMSSDLKENARALAMKVMEMSSRNLKSLDLTLNPECLGKMRILIDATSADEISKISISASHSGTRAMLESGIDVLKNLLESNSIFARTEVSEYGEESAFEGSSSENFAENSGHNQQQKKENEENQSDNGTLFAGGKINVEVSENHHEENNENLDISQNSNTVSYFA